MDSNIAQVIGSPPHWAWVMDFVTFLAVVFGVLYGLANLKASLKRGIRQLDAIASAHARLDKRVTRLEVRCNIHHADSDVQVEGP